MAGTWAEVALVLFVGMGPVKVLVYYLGAIRHASPALGRRVALRAVAIGDDHRARPPRRRLAADAACSISRAGRSSSPAGSSCSPTGSRPCSIRPRSASGDVAADRGRADARGALPDGRPAHPEPGRASRRPSIFSAEAATVGGLGYLVVLVGIVLAIAVLDLVVLWLVRPAGARDLRRRGSSCSSRCSGSCSRPSRSSSSSSGSASSGSSTCRPALTRAAATAAALALEPGRRVVRRLALVEVRSLLARRAGRDRHAPAVAGGLGRARPVRLAEQRVERRDVGLDRGRDDVRAARLAACTRRSPARPPMSGGAIRTVTAPIVSVPSPSAWMS